jgi:hypothetical protein
MRIVFSSGVILRRNMSIPAERYKVKSYYSPEH